MGVKMKMLETERLILRTWNEEDADSYFRINQDPKVIEFLRGPLTVEQVNNFIAVMNQHQDKHGYTLWATELKTTDEFMGFIGLNHADFADYFISDVEIAWRLGSQFWGNGYATEGAKAALNYGFNQAGIEEIIAFTVPDNKRSIRVMEKIGMQRDLDGDFAHPKVVVDHPLSQCVLYKIQKPL